MAQSRIKGRARFQRQLSRLGSELAKELAVEVERNAEEFRAAVARDVPRDEGELQLSVRRYEVTGSGGLAQRVVEGAGRVRLNGKTIGAVRQQDGFYATFVEFGTSTRPAQPHFFYNLRIRRTKFRARYSRAVRRVFLRNFQNG